MPILAKKANIKSEYACDESRVSEWVKILPTVYWVLTLHESRLETQMKWWWTRNIHYTIPSVHISSGTIMHSYHISQITPPLTTSTVWLFHQILSHIYWLCFSQARTSVFIFCILTLTIYYADKKSQSFHVLVNNINTNFSRHLHVHFPVQMFLNRPWKPVILAPYTVITQQLLYSLILL